MLLTTKPATILLMFSQLMRKYKKGYLYISQEKMLKLLAEFHDYPIKRRMLNYRLAELQENGLIKRTQRNKKQTHGIIQPMTSLIFLTRKGHRLIAKQFRSLLRAVDERLTKFFYSHVQYKPLVHPDGLSTQDQKRKARKLLESLA